MRALNVLLSILVSLGLALLVFEGGLRLLGLGPPKTINEFDPLLGWSKAPGASAHRKTDEFDVRYAINELGLRDDPMASPAKPPGTFRVLALGDSFVLGYTVARHNLFVDQLEGLWRAEGREVDVINAGTEAWSTDQEVAWFLEHGAAFEPDLVLIFPYENDIYWCSEERYQATEKPRFTPAGELEERALVDRAPRGLANTALGRLATGRLRPKVDPKDVWQPAGGGRAMYKEYGPLLGDPPEFVADSVARARGALLALRAQCSELGARLALVPIPSKEAFDPAAREAKQAAHMSGVAPSAWDPEKPAEIYLGLARELGIDALDPREALRKAAQARGALYYEKDIHLNAAGNLVLAEFLSEELDRGGFFPAEHRRVTAGAFPEPEAEGGGLPGWLKVFGTLLAALSVLYVATYRDEPAWQAPLKVGLMLGLVFSIFFGVKWLVGALPVQWAKLVPFAFVTAVLGFVLFKMGRKLGTIAELFRSFVSRGHWYLMPLVVVLLTIGSLLVVAASSPFVAPFIYTLF